MQSKKAYELVTTRKPDDPAFPHAMVLTVSFVIFPVIGLDCHRRFACAKLDASVEASEPHDFAVRVQHRSSAAPNSVHRIPPRVRDDRERPSVGRDGAIRKVFRVGEEATYFFGLGWTGDLRKMPPGPLLRAQRSNPASNDKLDSICPRNDTAIVGTWSNRSAVRPLASGKTASRPTAITHPARKTEECQ